MPSGVMSLRFFRSHVLIDERVEKTLGFSWNYQVCIRAYLSLIAIVSTAAEKAAQ